ncbi:MAG TPA: hypothetical protein PLE83_05335 [Myxococcota bacterium]|nr:hypothetical protein [Myxococcota bacterium]HRR74431.1 hypothetical protein [Myxococcota bacterium]
MAKPTVAVVNGREGVYHQFKGLNGRRTTDHGPQYCRRAGTDTPQCKGSEKDRQRNQEHGHGSLYIMAQYEIGRTLEFAELVGSEQKADEHAERERKNCRRSESTKQSQEQQRRRDGKDPWE